MLNFKNDYSEFAHEAITKRIFECSREANDSYGSDIYSARAKELISKELKKDCDIYFLVGGTQTNKTVINHILRPYQAVIACESGHINVHETGAIEATGHKVLTTKAVNGKITVDGIKEVFYRHTDMHMVMPKMVYVSDSTETGSIYTKAELEAISLLCKKLGLYLYLDGARLGVALTAKNNDLTLSDLASLCDVFYIGGTKNGALLGEAVVICNEKLKNDFAYSVKQNGALLAKGFLAGIQFETLFTENLYYQLASNSNEMARLMMDEFQKLDIKNAFESETNQVFVYLPSSILPSLAEEVLFEIWGTEGSKTIVRFVTSFATTEESVLSLVSCLKKLLK